MLEEIFENGKVERPNKQHLEVHAHTSKDQGIFYRKYLIGNEIL